jgi:hypothetical protein
MADTSQMREGARPNVTPQLAIGIFIMIAGVLLTLERLHVLDAVGLFRLWPAAVIAVGSSMLIRGDRKSRFWGWTLVILGCWLLLNTLGIVHVTFGQLIWPLILTFVGVRLVTHAMRGTSGSAQGMGSLMAVMGESKRASTGEPFRGTQMTAVMGGCQLDLRQAVLAPGEEAVIDVFAVMGGHELWVPGGWTVISEVTPIMASVDDKRLSSLPAPGGASEPPPRLLLRGTLLMGGLTIKN